MAEQGIKEERHKDINVPSAVPTEDTFSLDDFIQEKTTVPTVGVTVYLDAEGGRMLQAESEKMDTIKEQLSELESAPKQVLAVGEVNPTVEARERLQHEKGVVETAIATLSTRVLGSALYVEFQNHDLKAPEKAANSVMEEVEQRPEGTPEPTNEDLYKRQIIHLMAMMCIRITKADGKCIVGPISVAQFDNLHDSLIVPEATKLVTGMTDSLNISNEWTNFIDAGFPGRVTDLAG